MKTRSLLTRSIVAAVLLATGGLASAADVNEVESNDTLATAQNLLMPADGVTIHGVIGTLDATSSSDVDFYSFYAQAGDNVTFDIDVGMGGAKSVRTMLYVFDPDGVIRAMSYMNTTGSVDPGSYSIYDPLVKNLHLPKSGIYTVGVTAFPRTISPGGYVLSGPGPTGDYELVISGATPKVTVKQISIEVKPGSNEVTPVNPKSHGKIPVALLSESDFNAMDVDESSLSFGATGDENSLVKCHKNGMDVNGDGLLDKVCLFDTQKAGFSASDVMGKAKGRLLPPRGAAATRGMAFEGKGFLKVVPAFGK
ncbi:MAG: PPC domain-containing protein [Gammaproteobacteria bacterium]|jgi:hypothetical protein